MTQPPSWGPEPRQPGPQQPPSRQPTPQQPTPAPGQRPPAQPGQPTSYPPQYPPAGYPPAGYPQQGYAAQGYAATAGPPPQVHPPQGGYPAQGGYPPQPVFAPGGYPRPGAPGMPPPGGPGKKSPVTLILIVVAAVVALAAIGGIAMLLSRDTGTQPQTSITPGQPSAPPEEPTPEPSTPTTDPSPTGPSTGPTQGPTGAPIDVGLGIQVVPASGWEAGKTSNGVVQLTDGTNLFLGQAIQASPTTNPGQLCEAWHKQVADGGSGGKFADPKDTDLGTKKLKGATCVAQTTISNGQGSATVLLFSLVSVRQADGVTVLGTILFNRDADSDQLNKDFTDMMNSMLKTQS